MADSDFIRMLIAACMVIQACLFAGASAQETIAILSPQNTGQEVSNATADLGSETDASRGSSAQEPSQSVYSVGTNLTGTWSIHLSDSGARRLDLALFQNRGVILGYGQMTHENATEEVTAAGYLNGVGAELFVSAINSITVYRLSLVPSEKTIKGGYSAYSASGTAWSGTATGTSPAVKEIPAPEKLDLADTPSSQTSAVNIGQGIVSGSQGYAQAAAAGSRGVTVGSASTAEPDATYNPQTGGLTISKIVSSTYDGTGTTTTTSDGSRTTITYI
jgi:hypothetical protein